MREEAGGAIRIRDLERAAVAYGRTAAPGDDDAPAEAGPRRRRRRRAERAERRAASSPARGTPSPCSRPEDAAGGRARDAGATCCPRTELEADCAPGLRPAAGSWTHTTVALAAPARRQRARQALAPDVDAIILAAGAAEARRRRRPGLRRRRARASSSSTRSHWTTSEPGVYAGGGMLRPAEPWSPITSIADGRRAALSIDRQLQQRLALRVAGGPRRLRDGADREPRGRRESWRRPAGRTPRADYAADEAVAEAGRCLQCECLECVKACAYLEAFGAHPGQYARRVYNNLTVTQGRGTRSANKMIDSCSLCRLCYEVCPTDLDFAEVVRDARREMVRQDRMPASAFGFALEDLALAMGDGFALARHAPGMDASDAVFFPGCQLAASDPEHLELRVRAPAREVLAGDRAAALLLRGAGGLGRPGGRLRPDPGRPARAPREPRLAARDPRLPHLRDRLRGAPPGGRDGVALGGAGRGRAARRRSRLGRRAAGRRCTTPARRATRPPSRAPSATSSRPAATRSTSSSCRTSAPSAAGSAV